MIDRRLADHQAEAPEVAADHVVERLVAGMALDVLEQERGRLLAADEIGDGRGFKVGIDLGGDALELTQRLDLLQPGVEVARIGAARKRPRRGRLGRTIAARAVHLDARLHGRFSVCLVADRRECRAKRGVGKGTARRRSHHADNAGPCPCGADVI